MIAGINRGRGVFGSQVRGVAEFRVLLNPGEWLRHQRLYPPEPAPGIKDHLLAWLSAFDAPFNDVVLLTSPPVRLGNASELNGRPIVPAIAARIQQSPR